MKIILDPNSLTFGDLEDFESFTGQDLIGTFDQIGDKGDLAGLNMKTILGLVWVCGRQQDESFSMDDARKVKISDLEVDTAEAPDPTSGGG